MGRITFSLSACCTSLCLVLYHATIQLWCLYITHGSLAVRLPRAQNLSPRTGKTPQAGCGWCRSQQTCHMQTFELHEQWHRWGQLGRSWHVLCRTPHFHRALPCAHAPLPHGCIFPRAHLPATVGAAPEAAHGVWLWAWYRHSLACTGQTRWSQHRLGYAAGGSPWNAIHLRGSCAWPITGIAGAQGTLSLQCGQGTIRLLPRT